MAILIWVILGLGVAAGIGLLVIIPLSVEESKLSAQVANDLDACVAAQRLAFAAGQRCQACESLRLFDPVGYRRLGTKCSNYTDFETWHKSPAMEKICQGPC